METFEEVGEFLARLWSKERFPALSEVLGGLVCLLLYQFLFPFLVVLVVILTPLIRKYQ